MLYFNFFFKIFLMWTNFKVFIEFVTILLLFYVLVFWSRGMWDLSSPTRDWIGTPCIGRRSLNHWTTREVPPFQLLKVSQSGQHKFVVIRSKSDLCHSTATTLFSDKCVLLLEWVSESFKTVLPNLLLTS